MTSGLHFRNHRGLVKQDDIFHTFSRFNRRVDHTVWGRIVERCKILSDYLNDNEVHRLVFGITGIVILLLSP